MKEIQVNTYYTDYWWVYETFLEIHKHIQTKAETYTIEWLNNLLRHYIARFHRKTHCYSKSEEMVHLTLGLFSMKKEMLYILN